MSFNQNTYIKEYNKNNYKMYQFRVRKNNIDMIKYLDDKADRNSYIVSLIDKDINHIDILTIKQIKDIIKPILNKYEIFDIGLFGSYARGEANINSDVDIYCEKGNISNLIEQGYLIEELEKSLNKKVDVVFNSSIMDEYFEKQIMEDMIKI